MASYIEVCFSELYLVIARVFLAVYKTVLIGTTLLIVGTTWVRLSLLRRSRQSYCSRDALLIEGQILPVLPAWIIFPHSYTEHSLALLLDSPKSRCWSQWDDPSVGTGSFRISAFSFLAMASELNNSKIRRTAKSGHASVCIFPCPQRWHFTWNQMFFLEISTAVWERWNTTRTRCPPEYWEIILKLSLSFSKYRKEKKKKPQQSQERILGPSSLCALGTTLFHLLVSFSEGIWKRRQNICPLDRNAEMEIYTTAILRAFKNVNVWRAHSLDCWFRVCDANEASDRLNVVYHL